MASLTVEELKKALAKTGVDIPSTRGMKKDDYVKLYEEHVISLNESVGAAYSSDEESSQNQNLNGENDWNLIQEAVQNLSDDDLFLKLKEQGLPAGPIVPQTRKVYERRYLSYLQNVNSNGSHGTDTTVFMDPSEISDNEIEITNPPRKATPQPSTSKKTPSREPSLVKERLPEPRRISFIEEIPSGTNRRIIKPIDSYESTLLRKRTTLGASEDYVGKWSPKISSRNIEIEKPGKSWKKVFLVGGRYYAWFADKRIHNSLVSVLVIAVIALLAYFYLGWSPADHYKMIEEEAEELTGQQV